MRSVAAVFSSGSTPGNVAEASAVMFDTSSIELGVGPPCSSHHAKLVLLYPFGALWIPPRVTGVTQRPFCTADAASAIPQSNAIRALFLKTGSGANSASVSIGWSV